MATLQADGLLAFLSRLSVENVANLVPSADILTKPLDIYRSHLAGILVQLTACEPRVAYGSIQEPNDFGDLEVVVPRLRLKGSNPKDTAFEFAQKFPETPLFDAPFEDGIHLRLYFSPKSLARILLPYIHDRGAFYGSNSSCKLTDSDEAKKRVIVEFSSPNIGKEFDGAHLRSTLLGASIASLYGGMGWDVRRLNFLGDWGKHIGLLAVGWSRFGSEELLKVDPLRHLLDVYLKIDELVKAEQKATTEIDPGNLHKREKPHDENVPISTTQDNFFKEMEDGCTDAVALWKRLRETSVAEYTNLYTQLNVKFDEYSGESEVTQPTIAEIEARLTEKGIYEENNGAWVINFKKHGSRGLGNVTARHPNGTTSYLLRDVGAVLERKRKYGFEKMIYVVSAKQDTHFHQLLRTLELMGDEYLELSRALQHVHFGTVHGLSPRPGSSGLLLGEIIEDCQKAIQKIIEADESPAISQRYMTSANEFARLALLGQELSTKRSNTLNYGFGIGGEVAAPTESCHGLTMQRWLDRVRSKVVDVEMARNLEFDDLDYTFFEREEEYADILRLMAQFPDTVEHAFEKLEPSLIFSYLLKVTEMLPSVLDEGEIDTEFAETENDHEVIAEESRSQVGASQDHDVLKALFYQAVCIVLENGMNLIGLEPIREQEREGAGTTATVATKTPKELNEEVASLTISKDADEDETKLAMPRENRHEAGSTILPQEIKEEPLPVHVPQETVEDEAAFTAVTDERREEPVLPVIPQETNEPAPTATPQELDERIAPTGLPGDANEKEATMPLPEAGHQESTLPTVPSEMHGEMPQDSISPLEVLSEGKDVFHLGNDVVAMTEDHRQAGLV